jgi:hypothetical protein
MLHLPQNYAQAGNESGMAYELKKGCVKTWSPCTGGKQEGQYEPP